MRTRAPTLASLGATSAPAGVWNDGTRVGPVQARLASSDHPPPARFQVEPTTDVSRRRMLAGLRTREHVGVRTPRSYCPPLPRRCAQCTSWRSFSLTAAGQSRVRTGFPFQPGSRTRAPAWAQHIVVPLGCQPRCGVALCATEVGVAPVADAPECAAAHGRSCLGAVRIASSAALRLARAMHCVRRDDRPQRREDPPSTMAE